MGLGFTGSLRGGAAIVIATREGVLWPVLIVERPPDAGDDWQTDRPEVHDAVHSVFERFNIVRANCNPSEWRPEIDTWAGQYGKEIVLQTPLNRARFGPMVDRLISAVAAGQVSHPADEAFTRHMVSARLDTPREGHRLFKAAGPGRPIHAAIAAALALDAAAGIEDEPDWGNFIL
ncbi:MAG: hypothetical protein ACRDHJ_02370 [Actinomycetota bacterium]